jgi:hypothetical protein
MPLKGIVAGPRWIAQILLIVLTATTCGTLTGCAEGPFWRAGKYSPWAKQQWAEEERVADTLFVRKRRMKESVDSVINAPIEDQQRVANNLAETLHRDPVTLLRLHAVKLLGQLNCPGAVQALEAASRDQTSDIRIAAVKAWGNMPAETAIPHLQDIIGSDTNADVRMAATRALGNFSGQKAVAAISMALDDRDPALQFRAVESLQKVTGEPLGRDIGAWQQYVRNVIPNQTTVEPSSSLPSDTPPNSNYQNVADRAIDSIFR